MATLVRLSDLVELAWDGADGIGPLAGKYEAQALIIIVQQLQRLNTLIARLGTNTTRRIRTFIIRKMVGLCVVVANVMQKEKGENDVPNKRAFRNIEAAAPRQGASRR